MFRSYTVYRTQNIVNGRYYFGVHKTKNPYDGYLGSGKILKRAITKYGERAFIKNICFIFANAEEAFAKEFEMIETYRADPLCYNLRQGGSGGFDYINQNVPRALQKLTKDSVIEIRRLASEEGKFPKVLGEKFNVSTRTINSILRGTNHSWEHVTKRIPVVPAHRAPKRGRYTQEHKDKISSAQKAYFRGNDKAKLAVGKRLGDYWRGRSKSSEFCKNLGELNRKNKTGGIAVSKLGIRKFVKREDLILYLQEGWKEGWKNVGLLNTRPELDTSVFL